MAQAPDETDEPVPDEAVESNIDPPWWSVWLERYSSPRETDTDYDGAFSYAVEWHALIIGFTIGFTVYAPMPLEVKAAIAAALGVEEISGKMWFQKKKVAQEMRAEPYYALAGLFVGLFVGTVLSQGLMATLNGLA